MRSGALTARLVERLGARCNVIAIDPSESFVEPRCGNGSLTSSCMRAVRSSCRSTMTSFDLALAQLVVHFMKDPVAGLREMAPSDQAGRSGRGDGVGPRLEAVARCRAYWAAVKSIDRPRPARATLAGVKEGDLVALFERPGSQTWSGRLDGARAFASFEEWWEPYTLGVGPAGDYIAKLDAAGREALRVPAAINSLRRRSRSLRPLGACAPARDRSGVCH